MKLKDYWIFLASLPYFLITIQTAQNLPIMDDYDAILGTIIKWKQGSLWEKIEVLFAQYNEHRILPSRVVYLLYYYIIGGVNFRNLIILGNCQLLVVSWVLAYFIKITGVKFWQLPALLSVFLVFDFNTFESGSISMYTWQNNGVLMWFFLSLYFWHKQWVYAGIAAMFLLIFSSGNGMIGAFFISVYAFVCVRSKMYYCIIPFVLFSCLYFVGYVPAEDPTTLDINTVVIYFIRMSGAPFSFDNSSVYGIILLASVLFLFPRNKLWAKPTVSPLITVLLFVLASMATTSVFRSCIQGAQFQTSRYQIYPQMLISIVIVLLLLKKKKPYTYAAWAMMALWITVYFPSNYQFGKSGFDRTADRVSSRQFWHPQPKEAEKIAKTACELNIYCIEENR